MKINIEDIEIEIDYVYKPFNKGVYFTYKGNNKFRMSGFFKENDSKILDIVLKNKKSILKIMKKAIPQKSNSIHYLGNEYTIKEIESDKNLVYISQEYIVCEHKNRVSVEKLIKKFYVEAIESYANNVFDQIFLNFSDLRINKPVLKFKYTKSFYGKCFTRENMIELSGICMKMKPEYINAVIMHELCHFKYMNHQRGFYKYFETKLKNCKKIQHEFRSLKYNDIY